MGSILVFRLASYNKLPHSIYLQKPLKYTECRFQMFWAQFCWYEFREWRKASEVQLSSGLQ